MKDTLVVTVTSFGFKHGPADRRRHRHGRALPAEPLLRPEAAAPDRAGPPRARLRAGARRDEGVPGAVGAAARRLAPNYLAEGKHHLSIAMGCTGGMHRSVVLAEETGRFLRSLGYQVSVRHRDVSKDQEWL